MATVNILLLGTAAEGVPGRVCSLLSLCQGCLLVSAGCPRGGESSFLGEAPQDTALCSLQFWGELCLAQELR